jgi:alkanesulfonate monooxygenase SsuD/methylene tetrahydromethanopterin reductase-like flavin-dependent oxidoreductase (luciferase family)
MAAAVTDKMTDAVALVGPASRCIERLQEYSRQSGEVLVLAPNPVNEDYTPAVRRVLKAFAKLT